MWGLDTVIALMSLWIPVTLVLWFLTVVFGAAHDFTYAVTVGKVQPSSDDKRAAQHGRGKQFSPDYDDSGREF